MNLKIRIARTNEEFAALRPAWDKMTRSSPQNIFLEFDWLFTWWKHFGAKRKLFVVVAQKAREPALLLPLVVKDFLGFRCLEFLSSEIADYEGLLSGEPPESLPEILDQVLRGLAQEPGWDILRLRKIRETAGDFPAWQALAAAPRPGYLLGIGRHKEGAPFIPIRQTWEEYLRVSPPKFLKHIHRQWKRLESSAAVKITLETPDIAEFFQVLRQQHIARRQANGQSSFFCRGPYLEFFTELAHLWQNKKWMWLSALTCQGRPAAALLSFCYGRQLGYFAPAFDDQFEKYSVSRILTQAVLRESFERRLASFDFMLGEENYKFDWSPAVMPLNYVHAAPPTWRGRAAWQLFHRLMIAYKKKRGLAW
ncbi:MAG: GNAT family N-acetyltransferase [Candidatus Omnitrophica bacterium]|nr:GNAT family N-acetyltransferase [Candidatus Omnitrophota bacterium]